MDEDTAVLRALATEALHIQAACNLSGCLHTWSRSITKLRAILEKRPDFSTDTLNQHPISVVWASKIAQLTGCETRFASAYDAVIRMAEAT